MRDRGMDKALAEQGVTSYMCQGKEVGKCMCNVSPTLEQNE